MILGLWLINFVSSFMSFITELVFIFLLLLAHSDSMFNSQAGLFSYSCQRSWLYLSTTIFLFLFCLWLIFQIKKKLKSPPFKIQFDLYWYFPFIFLLRQTTFSTNHYLCSTYFYPFPHSLSIASWRNISDTEFISLPSTLAVSNKSHDSYEYSWELINNRITKWFGFQRTLKFL